MHRRGGHSVFGEGTGPEWTGVSPGVTEEGGGFRGIDIGS
jgi:hypothetical protein